MEDKFRFLTYLYNLLVPGAVSSYLSAHATMGITIYSRKTPNQKRIIICSPDHQCQCGTQARPAYLPIVQRWNRKVLFALKDPNDDNHVRVAKKSSLHLRHLL